MVHRNLFSPKLSDSQLLILGLVYNPKGTISHALDSHVPLDILVLRMGGRRVRFWEDRWCGDDALSLFFPSLFALVASKEAWVAKVWDASGEEGGWNPPFFRPFSDWEMETVERFLFSLQGKKVDTNMEDRVRWKEAKDGIFSVKSFYSVMEGSSIVLFPNNIIWSPCALFKVGFFAWEASWGKVLTLNQLKKRGWSLSNRCFICCVAEESIIIIF